MKPKFAAGRNIAMKVPAHEYDRTVRLYRDVLCLHELTEPAASSTESVRFAFGDKVLWIDRVSGLSQAEIWLEIVADDPEAAAAYLVDHGCSVCNEIEALPEGFRGCWISSPCNIVHLVALAEAGRA